MGEVRCRLSEPEQNKIHSILISFSSGNRTKYNVLNEIAGIVFRNRNNLSKILLDDIRELVEFAGIEKDQAEELVKYLKQRYKSFKY